jgi:hypothetical protein
VFGIGANNHHAPMAFNDAAFRAALLDGRCDFHELTPIDPKKTRNEQTILAKLP